MRTPLLPRLTDAAQQQLDLVADEQRERRQRLDAAMDRVVQRFGDGSLRRGSL